MPATHDLHQELASIVSHARALQVALEALPDSDAAIEQALDVMTPDARRLAAGDMRALAQACYQIHQYARWMAQQFEVGR